MGVGNVELVNGGDEFEGVDRSDRLVGRGRHCDLCV